MFVLVVAACPEGERWKPRMSETERVCMRSCMDIYRTDPLNCTQLNSLTEGCVCEDGLYRNAEGLCVIPALCQCEEKDGTLREVKTIYYLFI